MDLDVHRCYLSPSIAYCHQKRSINPATEGNADVHEFFVQYVVPSYIFSPCDSAKYVCRYPCFADVEKA